MAMAETKTGVTEENYDLISALYRTLQDGETCGKYAQDAAQADDQELVVFFQRLQGEDRKRADEIKELLMRRMSPEKTLADSKLSESRSEINMAEMR